MKTQGFSGEIIGDITFNQPVVLKNLAEGIDNITFLGLDSFLEKPQTKEGKAFRELFALHGIEASTAHAEGYDTALLLDTILSKDIPLTQDAFLNIEKLNGVSGPIYFNEAGYSTFSYILTKFKDGKIVPVEK